MLIIGAIVVAAKVIAGSTGVFLAGKGFVSLIEQKKDTEKDKIEALFTKIRCMHRELFSADSAREFEVDNERKFWNVYSSFVQRFPSLNLESVDNVEGQQVSAEERRAQFYSRLKTLPINGQNFEQFLDLFIMASVWLDVRKDITAKIREIRSMQSSSVVRNNEDFRNEVINTMEAVNKFWASSHKKEYKSCFQGLIGNRDFISRMGAEIADFYRECPRLEKYLPLTFPILANWVSFYDYCFEVNKFPKFDHEEFKTELNRYITQFTPPADFNLEEHHGFIEKRQLETKTKIFVRADLHGDLKTLIENLKILREKGLLDDNYRCRSDVMLVFLGDYVDRGDHSLRVLRILLALKLSNPDQVVLLRGNHEDVDMNKVEDGRAIEFGEEDVDKAFKIFRQNGENKRLLDQFYNTLPLAAYVGQKGTNGRCQYSFFTHGLFELHVDPIEMLNSPNSTDRMLVSKRIEMSARMQNVSGRVHDTDVLTTENKLLRACVRINALFTRSLEERRAWDVNTTVYNWGDIAEIGESTELKRFTEEGRRRWKLEPVDIKHYLRLISDELSKVKMVFRGHQHEIDNAILPDERVIVSTLSIAIENPVTHSSFGEQPDKALILTTEEKVRDWTKRALFRHYGCSTTTVTDEFSVYRSGIDRVTPEGGSRVLSVQI